MSNKRRSRRERYRNRTMRTIEEIREIFGRITIDAFTSRRRGVVVGNYAHGSWYPKGQERLLRSLREAIELRRLERTTGRTELIDETLGASSDAEPYRTIIDSEPRSPEIARNPYRAKADVLWRAIKQGARFFLWIDSSGYVREGRTLDPIIDYLLRERPYYFWFSDYFASQTVTRRTLRLVNEATVFGHGRFDPGYPKIVIDEEDLSSIPEPYMSFFALDLSDRSSLRWAIDYVIASLVGAMDGPAKGARHDPKLGASRDFLHFRWDQSVAGLLCRLHRLVVHPEVLLTGYPDPDGPKYSEDAVLLFRGM